MLEESHLRAHFLRLFGAAPELLTRSPGRVNLIGEHTDYNDGWVFPAALTIGTDVVARRRDDGVLRVIAPRMHGTDEVRLDDVRPLEGPEWTRYVRGVASLLGEDDQPLVGADLLIDGDLPLGSGLSSSASLELGVALTLLTLANRRSDPIILARLGQRVENEIIGLQSGIMDQLAVACGVKDHALLIDCRTYTNEPVPIPPAVQVLILDSAAPRTLAGSAYNQRRAECESAVKKLQVIQPDLRALRDVTLELLEAEGGRLTAIELQRARHVVTEDQRVLDSAAALRQGDIVRFGELMVASHASMRNDYEISSPELDMLVAIAMETPGVLGARLTGAGFGGCAVALVETQHATAAAETITAAYVRTSGRNGASYVCAPSDGVAAHWLV